jgi:hypothetical protein
MTNRPFPFWIFDLDKSSSFDIALRSLPFFSHFVLQMEIDNQFDHLIINFPFVMQNDWKTANFARLYYPHFTTFRNETSEYY